MLIRKIVVPRNAVEGVPDDFLAAFGIEPDKTDTPPEGGEAGADGITEAQEDEKPQEGQSTEGTAPIQKDPPEGGELKKEEPSQNPPAQDHKAQAAFAAMRVENTRFKNTMKDIAGILGVQSTDDTNALITAIQEKVLQAQAKQQNIPIELLQKIQNLEQENEAAKAERLQVAAYRGFQSVKDKFALDDKALGAFAQQLYQDGVNPFTQEIDLVREYRDRNFDKLLADAKAAGAREEAERAAKAANHSSVPGKNNGQDGGEAGKINTIGGLTDWLNKQQ